MVAGTANADAELGWRVLTWVVYVVVVAYAAACAVSLVLLLQDYDLISRLPGDPGPAYLAEVQRMAGLERGVGLLRLLLSLAYTAALVVWFVLARRAIRVRGGDVRTVLRHWSFTAWRIAIAGFVLLTFFGTRPVDYRSRAALQASLLAIDQRQMVLMVARVAVAAVLVVAMWFLRARVLALVATTPVLAATPVLGVTPPVTRWSPAPAQPARTGAADVYRRWRERRTARIYD